MGLKTLMVGIVAAGTLVLAGEAQAFMVQEFNADTDAGVSDFAVSGFDTSLGFEAQGRIGGAPTYELNVGTDSGNPANFSQGEHSWVNGLLESFTLDFDGTTATLTVGGDSVSYSSFGTLSTFDSLLIRTATPGAGTSVEFTNLNLDGNSVGSYSNDYDSDATDPDRLIKWLGISDAGDLASGFTLSGQVALAWTGSPPTNSNLAFQIKGADGPSEVPAPATLGLLAAGLVGLGLAARRRRRAAA